MAGHLIDDSLLAELKRIIRKVDRASGANVTNDRFNLVIGSRRNPRTKRTTQATLEAAETFPRLVYNKITTKDTLTASGSAPSYAVLPSLQVGDVLRIRASGAVGRPANGMGSTLSITQNLHGTTLGAGALLGPAGSNALFLGWTYDASIIISSLTNPFDYNAMAMLGGGPIGSGTAAASGTNAESVGPVSALTESGHSLGLILNLTNFTATLVTLTVELWRQPD
jgi:hypothetical protein